MASSKRPKNDTNPSEEIHVDNKNILPCKVTDEQRNFTETDAIGERISQLFDPSVEYKMNHKRRGLALIFNHERFFWHLKLPDRRGTLADRDNLKRSLTELGFEVKCFDDLRAEEVLQNIYNGRHAEGDKHDDPVDAYDTVDSTTEDPLINETKVDAAAVYTLPAGADFLMCYSVAEGYYSHRETINGSWYIQDLCEMIRKHGASLEFTELLMLVNRKVAHRRVDVCKDIQAIGKKQIPCFASMLTKKLHFRPRS